MYTKRTVFDEIVEVPHYKKYSIYFLIFVILLVLLCFYPYTKSEIFVAKLEKKHFITVVIPEKKAIWLEEKIFYYKKNKFLFTIEKMEISEDQKSIILRLYFDKKIESNQNIIWVTFYKKKTTIGSEFIKRGRRDLAR